MQSEYVNKVDTGNTANNFSFQQQNIYLQSNSNRETTSPFHLHENGLINYKDAAETAVQIIAAKKPITNPVLCRYLHQKRIHKNIANVYCCEVDFKIENIDELFTAIGFKNNTGGYVLMSNSICLNNAPKYVSYIVFSSTKKKVKNLFSNIDLKFKNVSQNDIQTDSQSSDISGINFLSNQSSKANKLLIVFDDFFDLISYQSILQNQKLPLTDFLILNTLDLFERSILLIEKYKIVHLYLRRDNTNKKYMQSALKISSKYVDESSLFKDHESIHDWIMHFGLLSNARYLQQADEIRLP